MTALATLSLGGNAAVASQVMRHGDDDTPFHIGFTKEERSDLVTYLRAM